MASLADIWILLFIIQTVVFGSSCQYVEVQCKKNENVTLKCIHPHGIEIRWYIYFVEEEEFVKIRGNSIVDKRFRFLRFTTNQTNMQIHNVTKSDLGLYRCSGRSGDQVFSQIFNLTMKHNEVVAKSLASGPIANSVTTAENIFTELRFTSRRENEFVTKTSNSRSDSVTSFKYINIEVRETSSKEKETETTIFSTSSDSVTTNENATAKHLYMETGHISLYYVYYFCAAVSGLVFVIFVVTMVRVIRSKDRSSHSLIQIPRPDAEMPIERMSAEYAEIPDTPTSYIIGVSKSMSVHAYGTMSGSTSQHKISDLEDAIYLTPRPHETNAGYIIPVNDRGVKSAIETDYSYTSNPYVMPNQTLCPPRPCPANKCTSDKTLHTEQDDTLLDLDDKEYAIIIGDTETPRENDGYIDMTLDRSNNLQD